MAEESHWHRNALPEWAERISNQLQWITKEIKNMTDEQAHLDADVQALTAGLSDVEAEIAALKDQPVATQLDFTALDSAVARLQADAPATVVPDPTPAPSPEPTPTPTPDNPTPSV